MIASIQQETPIFTPASVEKEITKPMEVNVVDEQPASKSEVSYDKQGMAEKFGVRLGYSVYADQFNEEDVLRWQQMCEEQHPLKIIFDDIACKGIDQSGEWSMSFYDLCYLVEKGEVVNAQNALSPEAAKQAVDQQNWPFKFRYTTVYGQPVNVKNAVQSLPMLQKCYEIGLINRSGGLMPYEQLKGNEYHQQLAQQQTLLNQSHIYQIQPPERNIALYLEKMKQAYLDSI